MSNNNRNDSVRTPASAFGSVLVVAMAMSIYTYIRLVSNSAVLTGAILILTILETARIVLAVKSSTRLDIAFDSAFFVVLMSVLLGAYRTSLGAHPIFLFATIFYRPKFMRHGNRRLAFAFSLMIIGTVLPVMLGLVTDSGVVQVLTLLYALLVTGLWVFCSKVGAAAIGNIRQ